MKLMNMNLPQSQYDSDQVEIKKLNNIPEEQENEEQNEPVKVEGKGPVRRNYRHPKVKNDVFAT